MEQKVLCNYIDLTLVVKKFIDYKIREYYEPDNISLLPKKDDLLLVVDKQNHPNYCNEVPIKILSNSQDFDALCKSSENIDERWIGHKTKNLILCKIHLQVIDKDDYMGNKHYFS